MGKKLAQPRTSEALRDAATGRWQPGHCPNAEGMNQHGGPAVPDDDALAVIERLAAAGHAQRSIAKHLGVAMVTFQRWMKECPGVREAYENGLAAEHDSLVGGLTQAARNGNIVAAIFLLKARHGYVEGQQIAVSNRVELIFNLPKALTMQQYEAHVVHGALPQKAEVDRG